MEVTYNSACSYCDLVLSQRSRAPEETIQQGGLL